MGGNLEDETKNFVDNSNLTLEVYVTYKDTYL